MLNLKVRMKPLQIGVIGIDHRHIFGMLGGMLATGAVCTGWWTDGTPRTLEGFVKRFPDIPRRETGGSNPGRFLN